MNALWSKEKNLAAAELHNLIRQCFSLASRRGIVVDVSKGVMVSQQIKTQHLAFLL